MGSRLEDFRLLVIPAAIAVVLTLLYFLATNGWERLATPIPGAMAVLAGVIGTVAGVTLDRWRRKRRFPKGESNGSA